jgi:hypothetical protein
LANLDFAILVVGGIIYASLNLFYFFIMATAAISQHPAYYLRESFHSALLLFETFLGPNWTIAGVKLPLI